MLMSVSNIHSIGCPPAAWYAACSLLASAASFRTAAACRAASPHTCTVLVISKIVDAALHHRKQLDEVECRLAHQVHLNATSAS
jgi:hypothetical protein